MKKFFLSVLAIGIFVIYSIHLKLGGNENPSVAVKTSNTISSGAPAGGYKDGTYLGNVANAFYGNIQVQAVISGGRLTNVVFLQYPSDRSTSRMINAQADPMLAQEAIQAQSAQVSGVSGATATSGAFVQSLGSALQQAS